MLLLLSIVYIAAATWLALYGLNTLSLIIIYWRRRRAQNESPSTTDLPSVTIQLPIYNEVHVVSRLLHAVANLDYPDDRLQIQILDDSTDDTTRMLEELADLYRQQGLDIMLVHRTERAGFKAGALGHGLRTAKGELIAVFDADFVPSRDWLLRTVPYLLASPEAGFLQTRWGHLNGNSSLVTTVQALLLDAHFAVEHTARSRSGCFINFNGTAGLWRRECIDRSGGWSGATLTEDLDLSFRAQIAGWHPLYLPEVEVQSELPPQLIAFRAQQFRWAKGSAQCLRRLGKGLLTMRRSWYVRLEALVHLSSYCAYPLMLVVFLLTLPVIWWDRAGPLPLSHLTLASFGPPLSFLVSQITLYPRRFRDRAWWQRVLAIPLVILLGAGMAVNNTRAVIEGLTDRKTNAWNRTPKFNMARSRDTWADKPYVMRLSRDTFLDILFGLYAYLGIILCFIRNSFWYLPLLLVYALGFTLVVAISLWQDHQGKPFWRARRPSHLKTSENLLSQ